MQAGFGLMGGVTAAGGTGYPGGGSGYPGGGGTTASGGGQINIRGTTVYTNDLQITDLRLPNAIELSWPTSPPWSSLSRDSDSGEHVVFTGSTPPFTDTTWLYNTRYTYSITRSTSNTTTGADGKQYVYVITAISQVIVTVRKQPVSDNQTVDSRLDLRYSTNHFADFPFDQRTYRGGLYAGYNADGSNVGRSYLRFGSLPGKLNVADDVLPVGGLSLYSTRLAKSGSLTVNVSETGSGWNPATLVWSNAPSAGATVGSKSVSWDGNTQTPGTWVTLNASSSVANYFVNNLTSLNFVVSSNTESQPAWAYFAKKEYVKNGQSFAPCLVYAFGQQGLSIALDAIPNPAYQNDVCNGRLLIARTLVGSGVTATLTSSAPAVASVPASVYIAPGQTTTQTVTFPITLGAVSAVTPVTISASVGGRVVDVNLLVNPGTH